MESQIAKEPDGQGCRGAERPALADLARLDPGELARQLQLALPGAGARSVASFNSAV
ncbi:hypothetical protein [Streptomyces sp. NRRL S-495]|uniref:hypothetical protein n=1 Tax=Streptomyces sp. NRRL S-495 TaxID=1609133 RepID=UPI000AE50B20|nr:hypothetical protein [Streptomyces sp. NRRL S-495]